MEEWKEYKIGDVCCTNVSQYAIRDNWDSALYLDTGNITDNKIKEIVCINDMPAGLPSRARRKVKDKDILFSTVRPNQRHIGILQNPPKNLLVSTGFTVLSTKDDIADPFYLYYFLSQQEVIDYLQAIAEQAVSTYPSIKATDIESLDITLPNISTQKKISNILKSLDDKIELNRRINENLEQQAQALFKSWFVDFDPFKDGEFEESELGMIPKGWRVCTLGEVTTESKERVENRQDVKVLSPVTTGNLLLSEEYFTKQVFSADISRYIVVKPKEFAYNPARVNIGSLGINTFDFDGCVSPIYVVFKTEPEYYNFFNLYRRRDSFKTEVNLRAIGGVRQTLSYKDFSLIKIVYPPINEIIKFNCLYSTLLSKQEHIQIESKTLTQLRNSLLPRLMSGELSVEDVKLDD